jgi:hypothetical protein
MRIRSGIGVLLTGVCCAGLAACTAAGSSGPDVTVTDPSVGRPSPPDSIQAALSRMAFTPYAALGLSNNDGLAPNESTNSLTEACMTVAGYPGNSGPFAIGVSISDAGLAFSQPWGSWGYLGLATAEQWGFLEPAGTAMSSLGIDNPSPGTNPQTLPAAEQTAIDKCQTIDQDFSNEVSNGPLAGIQSITNTVYNDVQKNAAIKNATRAWSACMARNGYRYSDPETGFRDEMRSIFGGGTGGVHIKIGGSSVSASQNQAQIAMAVTDANCTQSTDLAGIYLAVQASYEQQIVNANQQALSAAVQQYRADYQQEVRKLPQLLKTAKAQPFNKGIVQGGNTVNKQGSASPSA